MASKKKELSFEEALEELEIIAHKLESGKESLDESMKLYQHGVELKQLCTKKLKEAEGKWEVLRRDKNGEIQAEEIESEKIPEQTELSYSKDNMF